MRYFFSFFLMVLGWAVLSCEGLLDMPDEARYEEKIVVNGTLLANPFIPIDSVWVHTSSRVDEPFCGRFQCPDRSHGNALRSRTRGGVGLF